MAHGTLTLSCGGCAVRAGNGLAAGALEQWVWASGAAPRSAARSRRQRCAERCAGDRRALVIITSSRLRAGHSARGWCGWPVVPDGAVSGGVVAGRHGGAVRATSSGYARAWRDGVADGAAARGGWETRLMIALARVTAVGRWLRVAGRWRWARVACDGAVLDGTASNTTSTVGRVRCVQCEVATCELVLRNGLRWSVGWAWAGHLRDGRVGSGGVAGRRRGERPRPALCAASGRPGSGDAGGLHPRRAFRDGVVRDGGMLPAIRATVRPSWSVPIPGHEQVRRFLDGKSRHGRGVVYVGDNEAVVALDALTGVTDGGRALGESGQGARGDYTGS